MRRRPLLVVPGLGLGPEAWAPTLRALGGVPARVQPIPGYGVRADRGHDLSPGALAADLLGLLRATADDRGPVVLAGHSASCQVVVRAAVMDPERVAGLVLVGPTTDPHAATWPRLARRWLGTARHEDPRQVPLLVRLYARTGLVTMARAMDAAREDRVEEALRHVRCPVLVVRGRHDRICPPEWARSVATAAPDGVSQSLPGGGHMVPITHGRLLAADIDAFLHRGRPLDAPGDG